MRKYIVLLLLLLCAQLGYSQQVPLYSQYMINRFMINPAAAGANGDAMVSINSRNQWIGYEGAPNTQLLSTELRMNHLKGKSRRRGSVFNGRLSRKGQSKVGLGAGLYTDVNGRIRNTGLQLTYAYHLPFRYFQLSMGLTFTGSQTRIDVQPEDLVDALDPLIAGKKNFFSPDFNVGIYLSSSNYYVGVSAIRLFQSYFKLGDDSGDNFRLLRQYYFMGGYRFRVNSLFNIEPSILFTGKENKRIALDVNVKGYYRENYWLGLSYRTTGAMVVMVGGRMANYHFGYAFDYLFTDISQVSKNGSHELVLGMTFGASKTKRRYKMNRRF